jgi:hypothetical protein
MGWIQAGFNSRRNPLLDLVDAQCTTINRAVSTKHRVSQGETEKDFHRDSPKGRIARREGDEKFRHHPLSHNPEILFSCKRSLSIKITFATSFAKATKVDERFGGSRRDISVREKWLVSREQPISL